MEESSLSQRVDPRWRMLAVLVALAACGRSTRHDAPADVAGSSATAGNAGGAPAGGAGGPAGSGASAATSLIPAPIEGEHEVQAVGCVPVEIGQEYLVQPTLTCSRAADYDPKTNRTMTCTVADFCTTHSDCTARPFGRCKGDAIASCHYPDEACSVDADCTSRPNGHCDKPLEDRLCDPSGNCWPSIPLCYYVSDGACDSDADCSASPGGSCQKLILVPRCSYDGCETDDDCGDGQRCACSNQSLACIPAQCRADDGCEAGQHCRIEYDCLTGKATGAYCTTPEDTCATQDDCSTLRCEYGLARWECNPARCPLD